MTAKTTKAANSETAGSNSIPGAVGASAANSRDGKAASPVVSDVKVNGSPSAKQSEKPAAQPRAGAEKKQADELKKLTLERKDLQKELASTKMAFLEAVRSSLTVQARAVELQADIDNARSALSALRGEIEASNQRKQMLKASVSGAKRDGEAKLDFAVDEIESVVSMWRKRALNAKADNDALLKYAENLKKRNLKLKSSLSWRLTMPLRFMLKLLFGGQDYKLGKMPKLKSKKWTKKGSLGFFYDLVNSSESNSKSKVPEIISETEKRLWGGYSEWALRRYEAMKNDTSLDPTVRADVFFRLATWHAVQGRYDLALELMQQRRLIDPKIAPFKRQALLEAYFLCRLSRTAEARALLDAYVKSKGSDADVELMYASTWLDTGETGSASVDEDKALQHINAMYRSFGMTEIAKIDASQPLSIDNVRGTVAGGTVDEAIKVTVIVPVFNSQDTILTALKGVAAQTWKNLEVIVVDDFSTDGTADIVAGFCATDDRFQLIRQSYNRGSYFCRNIAIQQATGDFVTIHDADDWSHPERIELHVRDAQESKSRANISNWMRARTDFVPVGTWRPTEKLISLNMGSFFVDRTLFHEVGSWNEVRVSADREFIKRCELFLGEKVRTGIVKGAPLTVGRSSESSLTRQSATHVATTYHGVRRDYHEVTDLLHRKWHNKVLGDLSTIGTMGGELAPASIHAERKAAEVDVLLIGNWNMRGGTFHSARNMAAAAKADGLSVGFFHYPNCDLEITKPIRSDFRELLWEEGFKMVVAGEEVKAKTVIFTYPPVLDEKIDLFPRISHERVFVVVNQMAERNISKTDVAYDPLRVRENLVALVGTEGEWAPISNRVREIMLADARYPAPVADTWTPMTDISQVSAAPAPWRGEERVRPRIGRHGRDHVLKWPSRREDVHQAYCVDKACDVHFLGGAKHALQLLGNTPENWKVDPFGSLDVGAFLSDLDFFLHFPDEDYIEEFGRAPMEAMAAGVPVILPSVFKSVFGDAAIYAEPAEVWTVISELWKDKVAWQERSEAGRRFVRDNCAYSAFGKRIAADKP